MISVASILIAASAAVIFALGSLHLWITFRGTKLHPRESALELQMRAGSPRISSELTMWQAWVGFNASHSFGGMLFGLVYGYLALAHGAFLFHSDFLLAVGFLLLLGLCWLGKRYWFSTPFRGIALATILYVTALVVHGVSGMK